MPTTYVLNGTKSLNFSVTQTRDGTQNTIASNVSLGSPKLPVTNRTLADGSGANQAHVYWHDQRTLAASATDNIVLNSGSLTDDFGNAISLTRVVWVFVRLTVPATGVRLVLGNHPTNPWAWWFGATTNTLEVRDYLDATNQIDGWTVNANDTLKINNPSGVSVVYDIVIVGS